MKLLKVNVDTYKSIENSEKFSIDQVTCLVGKNEAGKSALLEALYKLNPVIEAEAFDLVEEYPRRDLIDYQRNQKANPAEPEANVLTTEWKLEDHDFKAVQEVLGDGVIRKDAVIIQKGYDNNLYWNIDIDEVVIVENLLASAQLSPQELQELGSIPTIPNLIERISERDEQLSERQVDLQSRLNRLFPQADPFEPVIEILTERLPKFVYFTVYNKLPGAVSMEQLRTNIQDKGLESLAFSDKIFLALLSLAGTSEEQIADVGRFEQYISQIEGVSNNLTKQIFEYWSQNKYLRVKFLFEPGRPEDPAPFNSGFVFRLRIENTRHEASVGFENRSAGFVWFFSSL